MGSLQNDSECHGTGKTGDLDVHFPHTEFAKKKKNVFTQEIYLHHEGYFDILKIKGCTRIVVGYSYNLLALK